MEYPNMIERLNYDYYKGIWSLWTEKAEVRGEGRTWEEAFNKLATAFYAQNPQM